MPGHLATARDPNHGRQFLLLPEDQGFRSREEASQHHSLETWGGPAQGKAGPAWSKRPGRFPPALKYSRQRVDAPFMPPGCLLVGDLALLPGNLTTGGGLGSFRAWAARRPSISFTVALVWSRLASPAGGSGSV